MGEPLRLMRFEEGIKHPVESCPACGTEVREVVSRDMTHTDIFRLLNSMLIRMPMTEQEVQDGLR